MTYTPEHIIFSDDLSADGRASMRNALRADADLRSAVRRWIDLSTAVGEELRRDLPATEALVLFALRDTEHVGELTAREHQLMVDASAILESAIERHPAVRHILERIREDAEAFGRCWNEAQMAPGSGRQAAPPAARRDRAPAASAARLRLVSPRRIAAAAAVLVLAVSTLLLLGPDPDARADRVTLTAADGAYRLVELPDGTDLRLAGPATLTYDEQDPRSVDLAGSAFFNVTPADNRFRITTSTATVEVLGTSFGVLSDESSTEVTLVNGSLRLASADGRSVRLEPGQTSRVAETGAPTTPEVADLTNVLRWAGLFVFRDTPLADVARTLGEEYDIHIEIDDELKDETLTGTFEQDQGVAEILRVISAAISAELDVSEEGTRYTLRR